MTEILIVAATALAGLILVDPFYGGALVTASFAKIVVMASMVGSLLFHLLGRSLTSPRRLARVAQEAASAWWPQYCLCLLIVAGSLYAVNVNAIKESFLAMGLGMLYLPLMAMAVASSEKPMRLVKWLAAIQIAVALSMIGFVVAGDHLYHESIFVAVPVGAYFLVARPLAPWQFVLGVVLMGACALSVKNTTFLMIIVSLLTCVTVWLVRSIRRRSDLGRIAFVYFGALSIVILAAGFGFAWLSIKTALPSGNVDYRMEMYSLIWNRFLGSPIWGDLFTDSSVNYFRLYKIELGTQNLPTHSDVLDILGHSGVIGIALWSAVVWRILSIGWAVGVVLTATASDRDLRPWRWLFVLFLVQVNAIVTYAVNPPLINPVYGFWVWGSAGLLWALHRHLKEAAAPVPAKRPSRPLAAARA